MYIADEPIPTVPAALYQLRSGDWITLSDVRAIRCFPPSDNLQPRVVVVVACKQGQSEVYYEIYCETIDEAQLLRDEIAADRNAL